MLRLQHLAVAKVHMHSARQTRIEAAYRPHDVNALELVGAVLLEDRRVLHRIFVRTRGAIHSTWIRIPGRGRIGMIVCDFALADYYVMRQHAADSFVEAAADGLFRHFEFGPGLGAAGMELFQGFLHEVQGTASGIHLEVRARAIAFNGIAPLGDLPFKLDLGQGSGLRQIHLDARSGGLDVADIDQAGQSGGPEARDRATASVECEMVAGPLVEPTRRHDPGVLATEIAFLRTRYRRLVPGMMLVDRVT